MRVVCFALWGVALLMAATAQAESLPYLFDQMKKPSYRQSVAAAFRDANTPRWFSSFLKNGNGVATPGATVMVGSKPHELYGVCEPHNCGGNFVYVLTSPGGHKAWGLSMVNGARFRYHGNPSLAQAKTLADAPQLLE